MQPNSNVSKLADKNLPKTIVGMAIPMLAGTFAMTTYQITNAHPLEENVGK